MLLVGAVADLSAFSAKLAAIEKKHGPFSLCISTGDVATDVSQAQLAVPTLLNAFPAGDLAPNLLRLGHSGLYTTQSGLVIGYLSTTNDGDVASLAKAASGAPLDVLLLPSPPTGYNLLSPAFSTFASSGETPVPISSSALDAFLAKQPIRYILAPSPRFFEREPYAGPDGIVTRIILLAPAGKGKERWQFAASLIPAVKMESSKLREKPANATPAPFGTSAAKRGPPLEDQQSFFFATEQKRPRREHGDRRGERGEKGERGPPPDSYTCHKCNQPGHWIQDCPLRTEREPRDREPRERHPPRAPQECWFCLSSPTLSSHLLISIGASAYLAAPKGGLSEGHVLIVPVAHAGSTGELLASSAKSGDAADEARATLDEMEKYWTAVSKMESSNGNLIVGFEVSPPPPADGRRQAHMALQLVPVPGSRLDDSKFRDIATKLANRAGMEVYSGPVTESGISRGVPHDPSQAYIRFLLPEGSVTLIPSPPTQQPAHLPARPASFPFTLPRQVLVDFLGMDAGLVDWKKCALGEEKESEAVERYKERFGGFDPVV